MTFPLSRATKYAELIQAGEEHTNHIYRGQNRNVCARPPPEVIRKSQMTNRHFTLIEQPGSRPLVNAIVVNCWAASQERMAILLSTLRCEEHDSYTGDPLLHTHQIIRYSAQQ
jgi:hypothetical protein